MSIHTFLASPLYISIYNPKFTQLCVCGYKQDLYKSIYTYITMTLDPTIPQERHFTFQVNPSYIKKYPKRCLPHAITQKYLPSLFFLIWLLFLSELGDLQNGFKGNLLYSLLKVASQEHLYLCYRMLSPANLQFFK